MSVDQVSAQDVVLLDWNESPIGPPESAVRRVVDAARTLHRYPRGLLEEVTGLAADYLGVAPDQVLLTAGVDEATDIALSLARRAWGTAPGFDGYEDRANANGKPFHPIPLGADWQPELGWRELVAELGEGDMVFLAQPNNPTGNIFDPQFVREAGTRAQYLFIDETYQEFSSADSVLQSCAPRPGLLVYRSFSKALGLAGIRLGGLVADAETVIRLQPLRRFMPIDAVSLNAAAGVLQDPDFIKRLTTHVHQARAELVELLGESGLFEEVRDTETNFVLARLRQDLATKVLTGLSRDGIRIKPCDAFGLPGWLRISVGSWDGQRRLKACLDRVAAA